MRRLDFLAARVVANRRAVIVAGLLVTVILGSGAAAVDFRTSHDEFVGQTATSDSQEYVESNFRAGPENTTAALLIVQREYHIVGGRDILEQLRYQQRLLEDDRVAPTLAEDHPPTGIANVIALVAMQMDDGVDVAVGPQGQAAVTAGGDDDRIEPLPTPRPSVDAQIEAMEAANWENLNAIERRAIAALNDGVVGPDGGVYAFVPRYYDSRYEPRAHATVMYVYQRDDLSSQEYLASQTAMREIAADEFEQTPATTEWVYGHGIVNDELDRSTTDSLILMGPIGLVLVVGLLLFAYRDPLDVLLALAGVAVVLVWTFGFMGWTGIHFNQLFVSIPLFLMGLSIDYAIHAFMRYRERRTSSGAVETSETGWLNHYRTVRRRPRAVDPRVILPDGVADPDVQQSMTRAVGGVGAAFVLVTLTTATGFGASVTSPVGPIRAFGIVAATGIIAALVVFGALVPAVKIELDRALEARGHDRRRRAFATGRGRINRVLAVFVRAAEARPTLVVAAALVLTVGCLGGAATLDTSFDQKDLHVESTPEWTDSLAEPLRPGEYHSHDALAFFQTYGFVGEHNKAHILIRGDITHPATLERVQAGHDYAHESDATLGFGRVDLRAADVSSSEIHNGRSPVTVMRAVAAANESFNETYHDADTDGDGIPDEDLASVYDALYETNQRAAERVLLREDGEYRALRIGLYTNDSRSVQAVADEIRTTAAVVEDGDGDLNATATGQPIVRADVQQQLFTTVLRGFALTLVVVLSLLVVVYRWTRHSTSLGVVTMLPVLFALAWILGTMALLGLRFNILTALITSFTIGLGVDYSIHVSERYTQELAQQASVGDALRASVYGTGGALLVSAVTTASGFGVLVFAILGPLQQFGAITAMTIFYALIASVVVLPSLLVIWTRYTDATQTVNPG